MEDGKRRPVGLSKNNHQTFWETGRRKPKDLIGL